MFTGIEGDDWPPYLDVLADVLRRFRVFDDLQILSVGVNTRKCSQTNKEQDRKREDCSHSRILSKP